MKEYYDTDCRSGLPGWKCGICNNWYDSESIAKYCCWEENAKETKNKS